MADLIENPVINSPFEEPRRHFRFDDNGITDEIVAGAAVPCRRYRDSERARKVGVRRVRLAGRAAPQEGGP